MTDPKSPFDDPQFVLPPGINIRHQAGADLLAQLAPLLAADGFDVDHLNDADPEAFNAALVRAVERHNMELSTPVGDQRARAINTLRDLTVALHAENVAEVQNLFGTIGPAATRHRPSSGHLTGITMETLDAIYRDAALHPALHVVEIPQVDPPTKTAAQDILASAAGGQAFRSLDELLTSHGGFEVSRAGLYLLAATVEAIADHQQVPFMTVLHELVPAQALRQPAPGSAPQVPTSQEYLDDFASWLKSQDDVAEMAPKIWVIFASMVTDAHHEALDPHDPEDFSDWLLAVLANTDQQYVVTALEIIKHYVQFRLRTDLAPEVWHPAHAKITDMTASHQAPPWDFEQIFAAAQRVDAQQRHRAMLQVPIVSGILPLRDWLATPQAVTESGVPVRADIAQVGAMIGLRVHGVSQESAQPTGGEVVSALDVPELMMWWWTLQELGIITVATGNVELGPAAEEYFGQQHIPAEGAEGIIATYIKVLLIHGLEYAPLEVSSVGHTLGRLLNSLAALPPAHPASPDDFRSQLVQQRSDEYLRSMQTLGLVHLDGRIPQIPAGLQSAVLYGLMMAMDYIDDFMDQNFT